MKNIQKGDNTNVPATSPIMQQSLPWVSRFHSALKINIQWYKYIYICLIGLPFDTLGFSDNWIEVKMRLERSGTNWTRKSQPWSSAGHSSSTQDLGTQSQEPVDYRQQYLNTYTQTLWEEGGAGSWQCEGWGKVGSKQNSPGFLIWNRQESSTHASTVTDQSDEFGLQQWFLSQNNSIVDIIFGMAQNSSSPDKCKTRYSWYSPHQKKSLFWATAHKHRNKTWRQIRRSLDLNLTLIPLTMPLHSTKQKHD